jgi:hypothetical protein
MMCLAATVRNAKCLKGHVEVWPGCPIQRLPVEFLDNHAQTAKQLSVRVQEGILEQLTCPLS